jgi:amino acid adenylation domain-containing protein
MSTTSPQIQLIPIDYNPFGEAPYSKVGRVVDAQKEIWLSCVLGGKEAKLAYNESASLKLEGTLSQDYLFQACQTLVSRHESLRLEFAANGHWFMVREWIYPDLFFKDLSGFNPIRQEKAIHDFIGEEVLFDFDLGKGPLVKFSLLKLSEKSHLFTVTAHHLVVDGWSFGVIFEEIGEIYSSLIDQTIPNLPEPFQFSAYAEQMDAFTNSKEYTKMESYWLEKYRQLPPRLEMPTDGQRPANRTFICRRDDFVLDGIILDRLKNFSKSANTSLVNTVIAVFEVFLHKITGQDDLVVGVPTSGQAGTDNLVLVGHCVNLLPIRTQVQSSWTFLEYLSNRKKELLDDYEHQLYTFGNLIQHLNIPRDPSRIPLVPVIFNIDMGMDNQVQFSGLSYELFSNPRKYENFELFLNLTNKGKDLIFEWSYNTDLFKKDTVAYWMEGFLGLLEDLTTSPQLKIEEIEFNRNFNQAKLLEWNATDMELPVQDSFLELFFQQIEKNPQKRALITPQKEFNYEELGWAALDISQKIKGLEIGKGEVVGILLDRNEKLLPALLGVLMSGCAYIPLDPSFPKERIQFMLQNSGASLLIVEGELMWEEPLSIKKLLLETLNPSSPSHLPKIQYPDSADLAYILYTSGSTGLPKGVKVSHLNLLNFLVSMGHQPGLKPDDVLLAITTISFDIAGLELFLPLTTGASIVLADRESTKDGRLLLKLIDRYGVTCMQATPATWRMLLVSGWDSPRTLKVLCGGEALPIDLAARLLDLVGPFWNVYGPTETTIWSTVKEITGQEDISIGRPIANTQIYILDEILRPCSIGTVGEICIGGFGVALGYHQREDLNKEKFIADPFRKRGTIYRTGDLGKFLPNGEIVCLGRMDYQVKIRGYRIELGEIEAKLNQIPGIRQAVVNSFSNINGNNSLAAYLVLAPEVSDRFYEKILIEIKGKLKESLPDYMIPSDWMILEKLPLTQNNKVDRKSLPLPVQKKNNPTSELKDLTSPFQQTIANIWAKVLGKDKFSPKSNFFDLGGHSLLAVEMMVILEKETGFKLPITKLFQFPILEDFAQQIYTKETKDVSWNSVVPIQTQGDKIPLFLIHGAGANITPFYNLAQHLSVDQPVYGIQSKGLDGVEEPLETIESMAAYYLAEIRKVFPKGPFHVGGQSFGSYVAFEIAKQLKYKQEGVGKVILFDVPAYQLESNPDGLGRIKQKINQQIEKRVIDIQLAMFNPDAFKRMKKNSFLRKGSFFKRWLGIDKDKKASDLFVTIEKLREINHKAMDNYLLSRYDGDIILFKAKIKTFWVKDDEYYGWKPYANNVLAIEMEGDHNSMVDDPALVDGFAKKLQVLLDE